LTRFPAPGYLQRHTMHTVRGAALAALVAALTVTACGTTSGLPTASIPNVVDTVSLYALDGTPLPAPSGYDVQYKVVVRTDRFASFDFAFNITAAGQPVLLPTGALGLGRSSGIQVQSVGFDAVTLAPTSAYVDTTAVPVDSGTVAVVHSRSTGCAFGAVVFYYAKIEVLAIDTVARRIDLQVLVDQNCGYRGLELGVPRR
jgi:hypothetical protein